MTISQPRRPHRTKRDRSRILHGRITNFCCDTRTPGETCAWCNRGPNDEPISHNRALASNA